MTSTRLARLSFACAILLAGCSDQAADDQSSAPATPAGQPTLIGEWRWVASKRGNQVIRPTGPSDSTVFEVRPFGSYREYTGGSPRNGRYWLAEGRLNQLRDTSYTVLVLDSSNFFPRSGSQGPAVAVRSLVGDSLVLSGTGMDSTFYTFVRVREGR